MGYYLNENSKGQTLPASADGKYEALIADGGTPADGIRFEENLICVVNSGIFGAAGYAYDEREFEAFSEPDDPRFKRWLTHPEAKRLSNFNE